ncbi:MAG: DNA topoisomerase (ATP-hydrolyzing) subunit B [Candidatus Bathyarchaeia archaeon]|jgi:DNA gyrase subunit B
MSQHYSADQIQVLGDLEAVRKRPAMYIGSTDARGLQHLVFEVVDNSIDEALAGFCKNISVALNNDGSVTVHDDGRGIPVETHVQTGKSALEVVMTMLHAGGKFDHKTYQVSGGLHGIGVSAVNALSEWLEAEVHVQGRAFKQRYERGVPTTGVQELGPVTDHGTRVSFKPDPEIFEETKFDQRIILTRLRELAFLTENISITFTDQRVTPPKARTFSYEGGIREFVKYLNESKNSLHQEIVLVSGSKADVRVDCAFQYTDDDSWSIHTFANNIGTREGGTHLVGLKTALTRSINDYAAGHDMINEKLKIQGDDVREGLTTVLSVRLPNPQFEGQTKARLGNSEVRGIVESILYDSLKTYFSEVPSVAKAIVQRTAETARARLAAKEAKELVRKKGSLEGMTLPGKLADCQIHDPEKTEIFIVEGDSAGGCFSGDTKLALVDGRRLNFKEIIKEQDLGIEHYCYTIRRDGKIGIQKITHPRLTRRNAQVVKVILDNGNEVICTPGHLLMLRNGSYEQATNLQPLTSLMPLHTKLSDKIEPGITIQGYEMVWDVKSESWIFTHTLADWYNLWKRMYTRKAGDHCHHIDFNKRNNNPTNLIRLDPDQHLALHHDHLDKTLHTPISKMRSRLTRQTNEYRARMSDRMKEPIIRAIASARARKQWGKKNYKSYMRRKYQEFYQANNQYREKLLKRINETQHAYWSSSENRITQAKRVKQYFKKNPQVKKKLSNQAREQWQDRKLITWRAEKTRQQWLNPQYKERHRTQVKQWWREHPEHARKLADASRRTWKDGDKRRKIEKALRDWRVSTPSEERGRLVSEGHRLKSLQLLNEVLGAGSIRLEYENRRLKKAPTALRYNRLLEQYYAGNQKMMFEAAANVNCKIKTVIPMVERIDVYDISVDHTHNFALAAGIFVHNSAKQARDRRTQAILPLRGKILNVEKHGFSRILDNNEIRALVTAIGTGIGEGFNAGNLRYGKIVLLTDADVDGAHIRTLLLTFLYRHMPHLIEAGNVFIAQPPLYRIRKGDKIFNAMNEKERKRIVEQELKGKPDLVQRFKGLGEMNPRELWDTTMNPSSRTLLNVTVEDAAEADKVFSTLMGDVVEPRRQFIQENADEVDWLDI